MNIRHRTFFRITVLLIVILLILAVIAFFFIFRIRNVEIQGNDKLSEDEVRQEIQLDRAHGSSLMLLMLNRSADYSDNDMVRDIHVSLKSPSDIRVSVTEQTLVGGIQAGTSYCYFNESGIATLVTDKAEDNIPLITGVTVQNTDAGSKLVSSDKEKLDTLTTIAAVMNDYGVTAQNINAADDGNYTAQMNKVQVNFGRGSYIDEKVSQLSGMASKLKNLSGTLHLEYYNTSRDSIVFTNDEALSSDKTDAASSETETSVSETSSNISSEPGSDTDGSSSDSSYTYDGAYDSGSGEYGSDENSYDYGGSDSSSDYSSGSEDYSSDEGSSDGNSDYSGTSDYYGADGSDTYDYSSDGSDSYDYSGNSYDSGDYGYDGSDMSDYSDENDMSY